LALIKSGVFADYCGNYKVTNKFIPSPVIQKDEVDRILAGIESALKNISE
jgi:4-aminobutyrate aminotransferase-like enzyme